MKKFEDPIERGVKEFERGVHDGAQHAGSDRPTADQIRQVRDAAGPVGAVSFVLWRHLRYPLLGVLVFAMYYWLRPG